MATSTPTPTPTTEIVVFNLPGQAPDTRISIFHIKELQVHSIILKLYSAYFRAFMDSADKEPAPKGSKWKYHWISAVDTDTKWYLTDTRKVPTSSEEEDMKYLSEVPSVIPEIKAFMNVMNALYMKSYVLESTKQLICMTDLADFYRCLPTVSNSLSNAFSRSPDFRATIFRDASKLASPAFKLRHLDLLNDCLIIIAGAWKPDSPSSFTGLPDEVARLARVLRGQIGVKIAEAQASMITRMLQQFSDKGSNLHSSAVTSSSGSLVKYYKKLGPNMGGLPAVQAVCRSVLALSSEAVAGEGSYLHHFLCAKLDEKDLPWDTIEPDW